MIDPEIVPPPDRYVLALTGGFDILARRFRRFRLSEFPSLSRRLCCMQPVRNPALNLALAWRLHLGNAPEAIRQGREHAKL